MTGLKNFFLQRVNFREAILCIGIFFLSLFLLTFIFRNLMVSAYLGNKTEQFNQRYHAELKVNKAQVQWIAALLMTGISLKPEEGDTLIRIDSAYASINIWKLLGGHIVLRDMELKNTWLTFIKRDSITNYMFLLRKQGNEKAPGSPADSMNYSMYADRLTGILFDLVPHWLCIRNFNIYGNTNGHILFLHVDNLAVEDHSFRAPIFVKEELLLQKWMLEGRINRHEKEIACKLYALDGRKVFLPFIEYKWHAKVGFDTVSFNLVEEKENGEITNIRGNASMPGLEVTHARIAAKTVSFDNLAIGYSINLGGNYIELDSLTEVTFNKLTFHPYFRYRPKPTKQVTLIINKPFFPAEDLFSSLPGGLFTSLEGIQVKGNLSYYLNFSADLSMPDSLIFETELKRNRFTVLSYGKTNPGKINESFEFTAYEKGQPVRSFLVGPENQEYRAIDHISPYLRNAILTSEDAGFYQHRGFIPDAFRESLITNIKERRFARGGSTISMQLVKNVFLSRSKTIARKVEEALLVWLIENQNLCSKDRMYEVYLNIIEWGPLIYGAGEASRFYFNKDVSRVTLAEAIFLASIIPRPKWFKYMFDKEGHLRESEKAFYSLVAGKMLKKGMITQKEFDELIPDIKLKGPARFLLQKTDTISADTIYYPEYQEE